MLHLAETHWNRAALPRGGGDWAPRGSSRRTVMVAIGGGSGSGKTRLAGQLETALDPDTTVLALDDFYQDFSHLPFTAREQINFDNPATLDWALVLKVLLRCRTGASVRAPQYDFATHTRRPERRQFVPRGVVIVEGLWPLLKPEVRGLFDFRVFLDCPARVRFERRVVRDVAERGRDPDSVRRQFREMVTPMHDKFVAPQARWADLVLNQAPTSHGIEYLANRFRALVDEPRVPASHGCLAEAT